MRPALGPALLLLGALSLAACGGDDGGTASADTASTPAATATPSSAPSASSSPTAAAAAFPLTVQNCGTSVTLEKSPQRVVLLDASAAAYLDAVDALGRVVKRGGDFPADYFPADTHRKIMSARQLGSDQTSTGGVSLSLETIIDSDPDLVIGYTTDTITRDGLAKADIPLYVVPSYCDSPGVPSFDAIYDELRFYGRAFENTAGAEAAIDRLRPIVERVTAAKDAGGRKAAALYVSSDASAIYTYSKLAMVHAQMEALGLRNVFADLAERSPEISYEKLIDAAPDVLILLYTDTQKTPEEITKLVTGRSGTDAIPAVSKGDVIPLLLNFSEPYSPITVDGLEKLQKILAE